MSSFIDAYHGPGTELVAGDTVKGQSRGIGSDDSADRVEQN